MIPAASSGEAKAPLFPLRAGQAQGSAQLPAKAITTDPEATPLPLAAPIPIIRGQEGPPPAPPAFPDAPPRARLHPLAPPSPGATPAPDMPRPDSVPQTDTAPATSERTLPLPEPAEKRLPEPLATASEPFTTVRPPPLAPLETGTGTHSVAVVHDATAQPALPVPAAEPGSAPADSRIPPGAAPAPAASEPIPAQVLRHLHPARLTADRDAPLEITLDPPELGTIRISVSRGTDGMVLHLQADQPETLDLLRRHGAVLSAELQRQGLEQGSFSFSGRQDGQDRQATPAPPPPPLEPGRVITPHQPADRLAPPATHGPGSGQSLDLRL